MNESEGSEKEMIYIYGIVPSDGSGGDDISNMHPMVPIATCAIGDGHVGKIPAGELSIVATACQPIDLASLPKESLFKLLIEHQRVLETILPVTDVLPVKFGTFATRTDILNLVGHYLGPIKETLAELSGKVQMELVVSWDVQKILAEIKSDAGIAKLVTDLNQASEKVSQEIHLQLGQLVHKQLEARRQELKIRIVSSLSDLVPDLEDNATLSDRIVANLGMLIDRGKVGELDSILDNIDKEMEGQLLFKLIGPLPPYSFATIFIERLDLLTLDEARKRLGLEEEASLEKVHAQYRKLAQSLHPDANGGSTDTFRQLTEDYHLVSTCLTSFASDQPVHAMRSRQERSSTDMHLSIRRTGGSAALDLSGVLA